MAFLRNLFSVIGVLAVVGIIALAFELAPYYNKVRDFDDKALDTYAELGRTLLETGSAADATVLKYKVKEGASVSDVEEAMKFAANEHNFMNVGELPLYQQVEAMSGEDYRFVKVYMYCNALTAARMLDYNNAMSAYLPCRIVLVEDPDGQLWLYTLNLDLMIHGGHELPPDLKEEALNVRDTIRDIMERGAKADPFSF